MDPLSPTHGFRARRNADASCSPTGAASYCAARRASTQTGVTIGLLVLILTLVASSAIAGECRPQFPYRIEWMGADGAYSTRISDRKTFWSFGDTYYGKTALARQAMVRNSIAISTCRGGNFVISYASKVNPATGKRVAFFESPDNSEWYWPKGALMYDRKLYVFLGRLGRADDAFFPFELRGTDIAIIDNPQANPLDWHIRYRAFINRPDIHAAAVVKAGSYAYIYATVDSINGMVQPVVLYRVILKHLANPAGHLEYLSNTREDTWKSGLGFGDARIILEQGTTEFSVHRDTAARAWRLVIIGRVFVDDKAIYTSLSASLTRPWEKFEYLRFIDGAEGQTCYAAKRIEGYNGFLYNCLWNEPRKRLLDLDVYRPVVTSF